jgi:hypothetical protein
MPIVFPSAAELVSPLTSGFNTGINFAQARIAGQHLDEQRRHAMASEELERQLRDIQKQQEARAVQEQAIRNAAEARAADEFNRNKAFTGAIGDELSRQQTMNAIPETIRRPDYVPPATPIEGMQRATISALGKAPPSPEMLQHVIGSAATMGNQQIQRQFEMMRLEDERKRLANEDLRLGLSTKEAELRKNADERAAEAAARAGRKESGEDNIRKAETRVKQTYPDLPDDEKEDLVSFLSTQPNQQFPKAPASEPKELASKVESLKFIDRLNDAVQESKDKLGPAQSRLRNFETYWNKDPKYSELLQDYNYVVRNGEKASKQLGTLTQSKIDTLVKTLGDPNKADFPITVKRFLENNIQDLDTQLGQWKDSYWHLSPQTKQVYENALKTRNALYQKLHPETQPSAGGTGNVITLKNGAKVTVH